MTEPVDHSTSLAVSERRKLRKSLRRIDMIFFLICALVGLDTLGQSRATARRRSRGSSCWAPSS